MSNSSRLFNYISPLYGKFFNFQVNYYKSIINKIKPNLDISKYDTILDVGCGTGSLSKVLSERGLDVTGIDPSIGMLNQARQRLKYSGINLIHIIPGERLPFEDKSFDVVITSYVAHGLKPGERINLYNEMKRVAKELVIIHDYNENRDLLTTIIEWMENGDYFNFIKIAKGELESIFKEVKIVDVDTRAAWYICSP